jgi:hypothetical protein
VKTKVRLVIAASLLALAAMAGVGDSPVAAAKACAANLPHAVHQQVRTAPDTCVK